VALETLDPIVLEEQHKLVEWTKAWYQQARAANHVSYPYQADNNMVKRLHQYYVAGLTPAEALHACFGVKH
jgi:hypothetical protein